MSEPIDMISKLRTDNQELRREIKRLKLVNELNIVLFQDAKRQNSLALAKQSNSPCQPCALHAPNLTVAANDTL